VLNLFYFGAWGHAPKSKGLSKRRCGGGHAPKSGGHTRSVCADPQKPMASVGKVYQKGAMVVSVG